MKKILTCFLIGFTAVAMQSCKKSGTPTTTTKTKSELIVGSYTRTKIEVSNTNSGTDWLEFTGNNIPEAIVFKADGTYADTQGGYTDTGNWQISPDGSTITVAPTETYTIDALDDHKLVMIRYSASGQIVAGGQSYKYWRYTYTK